MVIHFVLIVLLLLIIQILHDSCWRDCRVDIYFFIKLAPLLFLLAKAFVSVSNLIQWVSVLTRVGPVPLFFTLCPFVFSAKPLTDDKILDVFFNGDSEIEDFDVSDADSPFSSEDDIDDSDDETDDDAPHDASKVLKGLFFSFFSCSLLKVRYTFLYKVENILRLLRFSFAPTCFGSFTA